MSEDTAWEVARGLADAEERQHRIESRLHRLNRTRRRTYVALAVTWVALVATWVLRLVGGAEVSRESSEEQRRAVARDECRLHGHTFTEQIVFGMLAPQLVRCITCGAHWRIHPDDVDEPWGTP